MIYIKRVANADVTRQIDLNNESANLFFDFNSERDQPRTLTFKDEDSGQQFLGTIKKSGHGNTITGDIFTAIKDSCKVGDIIVFKTNPKSINSYYFYIVKQNDQLYSQYNQSLNLLGSWHGGLNTTTHLVATYDEDTTSTNEGHKISTLPLQQIFYGAPGTGKSHKIKDDANVKIADEKNLVFRTTFHPDSDYSTFVGAYKPTTMDVQVTTLIGKEAVPVKNADGTPKTETKIIYEFVPQAFLQAYVAAWNNPDENVYLVIEEINRGNCAQIFGDLFQLLDRKEGVSEYPIMADRDLAKYLSGKDEDGIDVLTNKEGIKDGKLKLPKNLYIWATMNTSDQSLFPIDSAFKRRWDWKYIPINTRKEQWFIKAENVKYSWSAFLETINNIINNKTSSEDKQLGFYFCKAKGDTISAETFVSKVVFYLWNDVFKDYGFDGEYFADPDGGTLEFRKFFNFDGTINEKKVTAFLKNIKIEAENNKSDDSGNDEITEDKVE